MWSCVARRMCLGCIKSFKAAEITRSSQTRQFLGVSFQFVYEEAWEFASPGCEKILFHG